MTHNHRVYNLKLSDVATPNRKENNAKCLNVLNIDQKWKHVTSNTQQSHDTKPMGKHCHDHVLTANN